VSVTFDLVLLSHTGDTDAAGCTKNKESFLFFNHLKLLIGKIWRKLA